MYSSAETGQVPWLSSLSGEDAFSAVDHSSDIEYFLEEMEKSREYKEIKRAVRVQEYLMHISSLPGESNTQIPTQPVQPVAHTTSDPLVLYDQHGITRKFRLNGVDALRTIPPFDLLTTVVYEEEAALTPFEVPQHLPVDCPELDFSCATSQSSELEEAHTEAREVDERSTQSLSVQSSSRHSSPSEDERSSTRSDATPTCARSREPSPLVVANAERSRSSSDDQSSTRHTSPLRASLSIDWPANEWSIPNVVYDLPKSWFDNPFETPQLRAKSPSPLPNLTPSPPPAKVHSTLGKRPSDELEQVSPKRARRSYAVATENVAGPSRLISKSSSSDTSEYTESEYGSPPPRRVSRSQPKSKPRRHTPASSSKKFYCIFKDCTQAPFNAPKDRNRHLDTHFPPRFRCPVCERLFPRDDALKRHSANATQDPRCRGMYQQGVDYATHEPYWKTCSMSLFVRPPDSDPLIYLWKRYE
ncbi:hypothetical protein BC835DRAFT_728292 [Cytidiella melzeri]|nr:hypothetical protein BC835DRAFT_728292 [Cytidiella melzeri]